MIHFLSLFQIPVTYPTTAPEIAIPELDGKTAKMYRLVCAPRDVFLFRIALLFAFRIIKQIIIILYVKEI